LFTLICRLEIGSLKRISSHYMWSSSTLCFIS
jgi:hypothetical protein